MKYSFWGTIVLEGAILGGAILNINNWIGFVLIFLFVAGLVDTISNETKDLQDQIDDLKNSLK